MTKKPTCPNCDNDDPKLIERVPAQSPIYLCLVCSKEFVAK